MHVDTVYSPQLLPKSTTYTGPSPPRNTSQRGPFSHALKAAEQTMTLNALSKGHESGLLGAGPWVNPMVLVPPYLNIMWWCVCIMITRSYIQGVLFDSIEFYYGWLRFSRYVLFWGLFVVSYSVNRVYCYERSTIYDWQHLYITSTRIHVYIKSYICI